MSGMSNESMLHVTLATYALAALGLYVLACWLLDNLRSIVQLLGAILMPFFQPQEDVSMVQRFGEWAVITGSTDGIGKEYAMQLARNGFNIVLISRCAEKLVRVASEIESLHPVKTKWIQADFRHGQRTYEHIQQQLIGIPVGVLVNNVGRMYDYPDELANVNEQLVWDIIQINIGAVTMMTRMLVNDMKRRRRGAIVNVSSGSELQPMPYMAVYAATKVYVRNFTLAIRHELAASGISVQLLSPMFVRTKMNEFSTTVMAGNLLIPDVRSYTRSAVYCLGKTDTTTGYWSHGIQYGAIRLVPMWLRTLIGAKMNERFRDEYFAQQVELNEQSQPLPDDDTRLSAMST